MTISLIAIITLCAFCLLVFLSLFKASGGTDEELKRWIRDNFNDQ